jgi:hypothetical protein
VFDDSIEMVEAVKGTYALPPPKPNKLPTDETGRTRSKIAYIAAGPRMDKITMVDTQSIVSARWAPPHGPLKDGIELSKSAVSRLRYGWRQPAYDYAPLSLYAVEGRLQLGVKKTGGKIRWLAAGEILGAGNIYAPFAGETCLTYLIPQAVRSEIVKLAGTKRA